MKPDRVSILLALVVALVGALLPGRRAPFEAFGGEPRPPTEAELFARAAERGVVVEGLWSRSRRALDHWLARLDPATGLPPAYLPEHTLTVPKCPRPDAPCYTPADAGADLLPFLVIAAWLVDDDAFGRLVPAIFQAERRFASDAQGVPLAHLDLASGARGEPSRFAAAEYMKDGLVTLTGLLGEGPWAERQREIMGLVLAMGGLPTGDAEVDGDLLQALAPLAWQAAADPHGDARWGEALRRVAEPWLTRALPRNHGLPSRHVDVATGAPRGPTYLRDHGDELIAGLVLAWLVERERDPARAAAIYEGPVRTMVDRILASASRDGLLYNQIDAATLRPAAGARAGRFADSWGYVYGAIYNVGCALGDDRLVAATRRVLSRLAHKPELDWATHPGHDDVADSLEGALYLLAREEVPAAAAWADRMTARLLAMQGPDGAIGASYLDGNWLRSILIYGWSLTRGARLSPWHPGVRLGAVEHGGRLYLALDVADGGPWQGRLALDTPRHRTVFGMSTAWVRLNQWPEHFTVWPDRRYTLTYADGRRVTLAGRELAAGIGVAAPDRLVVAPAEAARGPE